VRHDWGLLAGSLLGLMVTCCAAAMPSTARAEATFRRLEIARTPVRWLPGFPGDRIVLRYAVADRDIVQPGAVNCSSMRAPTALLQRSRLDHAALEAALREATRRWQDAAEIAFEPAGSLETADIVIGEQAKPVGRAYTNVTLAQQWSGPVRPIVGASVCLNPEQPWKVGFDGELTVYDLVHTLTHEIGHAIGLDHPAGRGHVMSFRYDESRDGLSEGDLLGAAALYGPRALPAPSPEDIAARGPSRPAARGSNAEFGLK
jgi:hypothetical protein